MNPKSPLSPQVTEKYRRLRSLLAEMERVLIAFSGGVDSTLLLKVAHEVLKDNVLAVIASSEIYPESEIQDAVALAKGLGIDYRVVESHELGIPEFVKNPPDRCYFCKRGLFSRFCEIAQAEGILQVLDGANFDDQSDFRPGSRAAGELGVRSPLQELGFSKQDIRDLSRHLGLTTWDKPAMACLASRIPYQTEITPEVLHRIAQAEEHLHSLGFTQLRVRHHHPIARIEVPAQDISKFCDPELRAAAVKGLKRLGYAYVTLDLRGYRTGSLNEALGPEAAGS